MAFADSRPLAAVSWQSFLNSSNRRCAASNAGDGRPSWSGIFVAHWQQSRVRLFALLFPNVLEGLYRTGANKRMIYEAPVRRSTGP